MGEDDADSLAYVVPTWTCRSCKPQSGPLPERKRRRRKSRRARRAAQAATPTTPPSPLDQPWEPIIDDQVVYDGFIYRVVSLADDLYELPGYLLTVLHRFGKPEHRQAQPYK